MNLYDIDRDILDCMDSETGEIVDIERLEALYLSREKKLENIALYIKDLDAEAAAIKAEEQTLAERRKAKENRAKHLKGYLSDALGGQPMETSRVRLSFRSSMRTEISDPRALLDYLERNGLDSCIKYATPEISTSEVGKLLKSGEALPGAELVSRSNLQIK